MQQRSTLRAIRQALRALYVTLTIGGALVFLVNIFGWRDSLNEQLGGTERLTQLAIGWLFVGILIEHMRSSTLRGRLSYLARILQRVSPDLRKREAVRILIGALDSEDDKVVATAHEELKRITQAELGKDPAEWRRWLAQEEKSP